MTAMSIRQESRTGRDFWAQRDAQPRKPEGASRGIRPEWQDSQTLRRPDSKILNEAIPLVAIGRNRAGLWVARDCDNSIGRAFVFKGSAIRFAKRMKGSGGCAFMFVKDRLELEPTETGANPIPQLTKIALSLLVWKARFRRFVRRIRGRTALKP